MSCLLFITIVLSYSYSLYLSIQQLQKTKVAITARMVCMFDIYFTFKKKSTTFMVKRVVLLCCGYEAGTGGTEPKLGVVEPAAALVNSFNSP